MYKSFDAGKKMAACHKVQLHNIVNTMMAQNVSDTRKCRNVNGCYDTFLTEHSISFEYVMRYIIPKKS